MRTSLLSPIAELDLAAKLLDASVDALLGNRLHLAGELLAAADFPEITDYARKIVGKMSQEVHRLTRRPKCLPKLERDPARMPKQGDQDAIFSRDGWRCRFCGAKVICKSARSVLIRIFPTQCHWKSIELHRHPALYALGSSLDHVVPHSRGGKSDLSNFVTVCYCCQVGRGEWTLEEMELMDPRTREPVVDLWDGLSRINGMQHVNSAYGIPPP